MENQSEKTAHRHPCLDSDPDSDSDSVSLSDADADGDAFADADPKCGYRCRTECGVSQCADAF